MLFVVMLVYYGVVCECLVCCPFALLLFVWCLVVGFDGGFVCLFIYCLVVFEFVVKLFD